MISIAIGMGGALLAGCGGGGSSPSPISTPLGSGGTPTPTPTSTPSSGPPTFSAAYIAQWPANSVIVGDATEVDTVPATDSSGKYTGTTQVTTTHRQQTGFAIQDEWLNNVDQVSLPGIGAVNRTTYRDASSGQVTAYTYWTSDTTGYHEYGLDSYVDGNNQPASYLTYSIRYSAPGIVVPANLAVGQTQRFSTQRQVTYYNSNGSVDTAGSYTQPYAETITLVDFEPVTVAAGTFQSAAKIQISQQGSYTDSQNVTETLSYSDTYWALPTLGTVQGQESINVTGVTADGANADTAVYPYSYDTTYGLQYASINGTSYGTPPAGNKSVAGRATLAHPVFPDKRLAH